MHLQQLTSMPFTSYMRQCLADIQDNKEEELDEILVHFVKVQYLTERVAVLKSPQLTRVDQRGDRFEGGGRGKHGSEKDAALAGCQAYLDKLEMDISTASRNNGMSIIQDLLDLQVSMLTGQQP